MTFSELTADPVFWKGCSSCINFDVLTRNNYTRCLCTGMLYDPAEKPAAQPEARASHDKLLHLWMKISSMFHKKVS